MSNDAERTPADQPEETYTPDYSVMVPCAVCGADCPEPLGVCPGPPDGSRSECEIRFTTALLGSGYDPRR